MKVILDSIKPVIQNSKHIHINSGAIIDFSKIVVQKDLEGLEYTKETFAENTSEEEYIAYGVVYNSLNFFYWGEPKWTVIIDGENFDGSSGMHKALNRAIKQGFPILDSNFLSKLSEKDFQTILAGNVEIPFFKERLNLLRDLGKIVSDKFSGSFTNIIKKGNGDAVEIVKVLVTDLPSIFNDVANYHGHEIKFYKRAQLVPAHLFDLKNLGLISINLTGYGELTAFADYKVPQLLRKFKILEYSEDLANRIDKKIEIPAGSDEEIEIRANTIWAVELVARQLKSRFPQANAAKVDGIFWFKGQVKSPDDKPYHRTRTIWY